MTITYVEKENVTFNFKITLVKPSFVCVAYFDCFCFVFTDLGGVLQHIWPWVEGCNRGPKAYRRCTL